MPNTCSLKSNIVQGWSNCWCWGPSKSLTNRHSCQTSVCTDNISNICNHATENDVESVSEKIPKHDFGIFGHWSNMPMVAFD